MPLPPWNAALVWRAQFVDSVVGSVLWGEIKILRINFLLRQAFQDSSWCLIQSLPAYSVV